MEFSSETPCATQAHRNIAWAARRRTPLETSLRAVDDPLWRAACTQYFDFTTELLSELFERPEECGICAGEWEALLGGRSYYTARRLAPSKAESVRSATYDVANGYLRFLFVLGEAADPEPAGMTLGAQACALIRKRFDPSLKKSATNDSRIPLQQRLAVLSRCGMDAVVEDGALRLSSVRYPGMFQALCALAKKAKDVKTFGEQNFFCCEFRQIFSPYRPTIEDVFAPLAKAEQQLAWAVHELCRERRLTPSITTYWKVNYARKGKHVACIGTEAGRLNIRIDGAERFQTDRLLELVAAEGEAFQRYFMRHLNYCTACSTSHIGGFAEIFGKRKRLCCYATPSLRFRRPAAEDLPYLARFLDIRVGIVDGLKRGTEKERA